jgi:hypothetical protein
MAKSAGDNPFPLSEMMTQGFEQTRKAMESFLDLFQKNIKASPLLETDLNQKMWLQCGSALFKAIDVRPNRILMRQPTCNRHRGK